jgi:hypothetical protein
MAEITRQQNLLVAEDWKKVYQSFRNADFQAYDYETLRKAMIDYLRTYYPEDFNDFIESSEYIALIDLIAFLGQSLAFRADLNARENYIDTAERRDSILRLARLISYNAKRNKTASGFLKFESVSTTESITDSEGINLANRVINWNDTTNPNWSEQFITVLNASMVKGQRTGKPGNSTTINGIKNDEYKINLSGSTNNVFPFQAQVQGSNVNFEVVGATTQNQTYVYEVAPNTSGTFNMLYRNDNQGNASNDTGWFLFFKQGTRKALTLNLAESLVNRVVSVNEDNINDSDVWVYKIDNNGLVNETWTEVPSVGASNVAYNKLSQTNRKLYEINTRLNDQIDLVFGDGVFAEIPQGNFRVYYRTSNNLTYKITPDEITNISFSFPYQNKNNRTETLTVVASLKYTVANGMARETINEIKTRAPQQYYTQNRMVNGEDYNIVPFTQFSNILKAKAVNRTSSGISRYLDVLDTTGKYSSTNIFCQDGIIYNAIDTKSFDFEWTTTSDIQQIIEGDLTDILYSKQMLHFYYAYIQRYVPSNDTFYSQATTESNKSTGSFNALIDGTGAPYAIGELASDANLKNIKVGSLVKFWAGSGKYFDNNRQIQTGTVSLEGETEYIYSTVLSINGDGIYDQTELQVYGVGPVVLNDIIPTGAKVVQIIPAYTNSLASSVRQTITTKIREYKDFGLGYDQVNLIWYVINAEDLDTVSDYSQTYAQDTSTSNLDASWLIRFETDGNIYTVYYKTLDYYFESELETRFYFDKNQRIYDPSSGYVITDTINVLRFNTKPDTSTAFNTVVPLKIYDNVVEDDGYENNKKIRITYNDFDDDGIPDNPDFFTEVVAPTVNPTTKRVYYEITDAGNIPLPTGTVITLYPTFNEINLKKDKYVDGTVFYAETDAKFYILNVDGSLRTIEETDNYTYEIGRQDIYFQYRHNSPNNRRIDPSPNNIIDLYLLTKNYDTDYRAWLADTTGKVEKPTEATSEELRLEFQDLENYKMISDTIIFNNVRFKPLFGTKADIEFQAKFKIVKSEGTMLSDTEIKLRAVTALNNYFSNENWDFGETFYYTELSAYMHKILAGAVSSIVLVPKDSSKTFGSLFQVNAEPDQIFVNAATVNDVEIIAAITPKQLNQA